MHDWLGLVLFSLGLGLIVSGIAKRRKRMRVFVRSDDIRPEFAAMGAIARPIILFGVGVFALKMTLFYFVLGGQRFLTAFEFAGLLFVLAAYAGWLVLATTRPVNASVPMPSGERSVA